MTSKAKPAPTVDEDGFNASLEFMEHNENKMPGQATRSGKYRSPAQAWLKRQVIEDRTLFAIVSKLVREANGEGKCAITQSRIAVLVGISERSVRRAMPVLENIGILRRSYQENYQKRGRPADIIALSIDREFCVDKQAILNAKRLGPTGQNIGLIAWDQPDKMAGAPTPKKDAFHIEEHARSVLLELSSSLTSVSCTTRVRFDRGRERWRASITVDGVSMDLGRFDTRTAALEFSGLAKKDVQRAANSKDSGPRHPVVDPKIAALDGVELFRFLESDHLSSSKKNSSQSPQGTSNSPRMEVALEENGVGEAGALGQGSKILAGLGGAHELGQGDTERTGEPDVPVATEQGLVPPADPIEARLWLQRICNDRSKIAWAMRLLARNKLTDEIIRELAA